MVKKKLIGENYSKEFKETIKKNKKIYDEKRKEELKKFKKLTFK